MARPPAKPLTGLGLAVLFWMLPILAALGQPVAAVSTIPALKISDSNSQPLTRHMVYHVDKAEQLDIATLMAELQTLDWTPVNRDVSNLGLTSGSVWFGVRLISLQDTRRLLSIAYPPLDHVAVYLVRRGRVISELETGDQYPVNSRPIHHRDYVLPLELEADSEYQLFIRVQTQGPLHLPATLWKPDGFLEHTQKGFALQLLFIGIMAALAIYNLLLCFVVRDRAYYWYVAYLASFLLAQITLRGLGFQYLWPGLPELNNFGLPLLLSISLGAVGFFTHNFLHAGQYHRFWSVAILAVGWSGVLLTAMSLVVPYALLIALLIVSVTVGAVVLFLAGIYLWWKGQPLARVYVMAWSVFLLGNVIFNLEKAGILPYTAFSEHTVQVGTVVQMLLLSFALAQRINLEREQRQEAQAHALKIQREANEQLERHVKERTTEVRQAYDKLKEISQLDGLTQLKNRQFFDQALEKEWRRNARENQNISLLLLDVDHFKATNDNLGHLCGDACLRHLSRICQRHVHRPHDVVARYGGEEFVVLLPAAPLSGAMAVAENIRQDVERDSLQWEGQTVPLTISIGVASCIPDQTLDIDWLVRHADEALYAAKAAGRNRTMAYLDESVEGERIVPVEEFLAQAPGPNRPKPL